MKVIKNSKITFSGKEDDANIYVIEEEDVTNLKIYIQKQEQYSEESKIYVLVYLKVGEKIYGVSKLIDAKPMIYHHKIGKCSIQNYNLLQISGQFKYFDMNMWLNTIFNDFGPPVEFDKHYESFYQSILTKQRIEVTYSNSSCEIKAQNPHCLVIMKSMLAQRAREKHLSLNFSTQLNANTIHSMLKNLAQIIKPFQRIKQQYQLLPALMQLKNEQSLSEQLQNVLACADQIQANYESTNQKYQTLLKQVKQTYVSYQLLKDKEITKYQLEVFENLMRNFDAIKIGNCILK